MAPFSCLCWGRPYIFLELHGERLWLTRNVCPIFVPNGNSSIKKFDWSEYKHWKKAMEKWLLQLYNVPFCERTMSTDNIILSILIHRNSSFVFFSRNNLGTGVLKSLCPYRTSVNMNVCASFSRYIFRRSFPSSLTKDFACQPPMKKCINPDPNSNLRHAYILH